MKNVKIILILMVVALMAMPAMAAVSENFDAFTQGSYGNYTYNGFYLANALCNNVTSTTCVTPMLSNAVRLRNATGTYLEYVGIDGNGKDGGVGDISFYYHSWTTSAAVYNVSVSIDGGAYTIIGSQINSADCAYTLWTYTLNSASDNIKIRVERVSGERLHVDDFSITDFGGGGGYDSDAHILTGGVGAQATISSLVDTQLEKQIVHTCQLVDDGTGSNSTNTTVNTIVYAPANANDIAWNVAIAGAELFDGTNTFTGVVGATSITFTGSPLLTLTDGGSAVTLELSLWLAAPLPYYADHSRFEFVLGPSSILVEETGSHFDETDTPVESGDLNNEIDIVATGIGITTQPAALIGVNAPFLVRAGFVDENGGIDEDWPAENITLSVNTGTGNLTRTGGLTVLSASGQSLFNDLLYDALGTGIILQATSGSFAGPALTIAFNTYLAPTITIDAYPLCWDGDSTANAQPFAVHVSISNWTAAYGSDIRLKMYDGVSGGSDCFQYTAALGWSSSNVYANKPQITIDNNGNWSGWVAIKSHKLFNIKARARLVTNNTLQLTSASAIGTALDLNPEDGAQGGIVYDDNSHATAGNIILARGPSNEILGSYIAEDNGLPQDQTYATVSAGGWCMAMCEGYCDEEITFESWNPTAWPGNGAPEFTDVETFCLEGGLIVSIDVILPVELLSFTATASDASVTLNWATASETNSSRFDIFRNNELVHQVDAANSPSGSTYAWTDNSVINGTLYTYSLNVVDLAGNSEEIATTEASPSFNDATVTEYALHQNFPNPFNPETAIAFDLVDGGFVTLSVYNVLGQQVASLVNGTMNAGRHVVNFSATDLPSGLYLYRIEANGFTAQKKMIVMK